MAAGTAAGLISLATIVTSREAKAYPFYIDSQTGIGQFRSTDKVFDSGSSGASDMGLGFNLGIFWSPFGASHGMEIQLGLQNQLLIANQGAASFTLLAPTPIIRIQFLSAYVSAGAAPAVWLRNQAQAGIDGFALGSGTYLLLGEAGALYAATPKFSMGGALVLNWFYTGGAIAPMPASNLAFVMRFYFGNRGTGSAESGGTRALEWNGWRYIGK